jgi:hypothetical protein
MGIWEAVTELVGAALPWDTVEAEAPAKDEAKVRCQPFKQLRELPASLPMQRFTTFGSCFGFGLVERSALQHIRWMNTWTDSRHRTTRAMTLTTRKRIRKSQRSQRTRTRTTGAIMRRRMKKRKRKMRRRSLTPRRPLRKVRQSWLCGGRCKYPEQSPRTSRWELAACRYFI